MFTEIAYVTTPGLRADFEIILSGRLSPQLLQLKLDYNICIAACCTVLQRVLICFSLSVLL